MRKDFGAKPFTYPQPVLILGSYDKDGNPDAMNAAWGGISGGNEIVYSLNVSNEQVAKYNLDSNITISKQSKDDFYAQIKESVAKR